MKNVIKHKLTNDHDEWLKQRNKGIGGSDAGAILGFNKYKSAYTLWCEKTGTIKVPDIDNEAMRVGRDLEEYVAKRFVEATGKRVKKSGYSFQSKKHPFMLANVDRLIIGEDAGLECKTANAMTKVDYANGSIPETYYAQCVHYMAVTGLSKWYIAVLVMGKGFYFYEVERNEDEINTLIETEKDFWQHVVDKVEPPIDGSESTEKSIELRFGSSDEVTADVTLIDNDLEIINNIDNQIKELKTLREEHVNVAKRYLENASSGFSNKWKVTYRESKPRETVDSAKLKKLYPDIYKDVIKQGQPSRPFKLSKIEEEIK